MPTNPSCNKGSSKQGSDSWYIFRQRWRHGHNDARIRCQSRCHISLEPKFGGFTVAGTAGVLRVPTLSSVLLVSSVDNVGMDVCVKFGDSIQTVFEIFKLILCRTNEQDEGYPMTQWNIQTLSLWNFVISSKPSVKLRCQQLQQNMFWVSPQFAPHFTHYHAEETPQITTPHFTNNQPRNPVFYPYPFLWTTIVYAYEWLPTISIPT